MCTGVRTAILEDSDGNQFNCAVTVSNKVMSQRHRVLADD